MPGLDETQISKAIITAYHEKLLDRLQNDVIIVGAGPAGMMGGIRLARQGMKVTIIEKRLSPGGGVWGGGMAMNEAVIQEEALPLLDEVGIRHQPSQGGLHTTDAVELASGLCFHALQSGVILFNLMTVEDVCVHQKRVTGVVVNRTMVGGALPVDPIVLKAKAVVDATGHEAVVIESLRKRRLLAAVNESVGEGPMDAGAGEDFVAEKVTEVFPGLWVSGMSVCAALGGPRMGPIFGGMLLSGVRMADLVSAAVSKKA
ncbi:thiazole biosynthesis protein [bacterium]|nr:thiazole biosynthesis protein [bacterium]